MLIRPPQATSASVIPCIVLNLFPNILGCRKVPMLFMLFAWEWEQKDKLLRKSVRSKRQIMVYAYTGMMKDIIK